MTKRAPVNPMQDEREPRGKPEEQDPNGFQNFVSNTQFLQHVHKGGHIPMWLHPKLAHQILMQHGQSGAAVLHPNIDLNDLSK